MVFFVFIRLCDITDICTGKLYIKSSILLIVPATSGHIICLDYQPAHILPTQAKFRRMSNLCQPYIRRLPKSIRLTTVSNRACQTYVIKHKVNIRQTCG